MARKKVSKRKIPRSQAKKKTIKKMALKLKAQPDPPSTPANIPEELFDSKPETLEEAIKRLTEIAKKTEKSDPKTSIQAQKELNRLHNLYPDKSQKSYNIAQLNAEMERKLGLIEDYILPLKLIDENYPIEEHVRVAADKLRKSF